MNEITAACFSFELVHLHNSLCLLFHRCSQMAKNAPFLILIIAQGAYISSFLLYSSLAGSKILAILNSSAVNIYLWVVFLFRESHRSRLAVSDGRFIFVILRNLHTAFLRRWTNLYYYQQRISVPLFPHPFKYFFFLI